MSAGKYELHHLLSALPSMELTVDEKLGIIKTEYHVPVDDGLRKDVSALCNLYKAESKGDD